MAFLAPVLNHLEAMLPAAAQQEPATAARHRAFIVRRFVGASAALASLPIYIAIRGVPSALELGIFAWLLIPILIVLYLSRTGRYGDAHVLSALSLTCLAFFVAFCSGGIQSFAALWLVTVPFGTAISGSRRLIGIATAMAMMAAALLVLFEIGGIIPASMIAPREQTFLLMLSTMAALAYACGSAMSAAAVDRTAGSLCQEDIRFDRLARAIPDVIVHFASAGSVLFASPSAQRLFGVAESELSGNGLFELVHVADRPAFLTTLSNAAASGEGACLAFRIRRRLGADRPGEFVWVEMKCRALDGVDGAGEAEPEIVAVLRDINDRKPQEAAMRDSTEESERRSKTLFVARVSHEFRTPLNAIIGFSEMLMNAPAESSSRSAEYAKLINESGHHLLHLVNGILDASRIEAGRRELAYARLAPGPIIRHCADLLALKARETGIEIVLQLARGLPEIVFDRNALIQILTNLISNAIKFTPPGGRVTVRASCEGQKFHLIVSDTGVGISEADLPRVGEAFFRAPPLSGHRQPEGSGLGLSIVKGLVRLHAGEFDIRSRVGEGTRVAVSLPVMAQSARPRLEPAMLVAQAKRRISPNSDVQVKKSA